MTRAEQLTRFLDRAARTPFAWGRFDCSLWLADWLVDLGRPDPAAHLRGRYRTALGCARLLSRYGGVLGAVGHCAEIAGLSTAVTLACGDVGVVEVITSRGRQPAGGIYTGARWAVLGSGGLVVEPMARQAAWSV